MLKSYIKQDNVAPHTTSSCLKDFNMLQFLSDLKSTIQSFEERMEIFLGYKL